MSSLTELQEAVYDRVVEVVDGYVANPHQHVVRPNEHNDEQSLTVSLSFSTTDDSIGLHDSRVLEIQRNPYDVKYGNDKIANVDVTINDGNPTQINELHDELQNAFTFDSRVRYPQSLVGPTGPPIDDVSTRDMSPTGRDVGGVALAVEIEYTRTYWHSDLTEPPKTAKRVFLQFESGETVNVTE